MKKLDIFKPESFIAFYLLFILLAGIGFLYWKSISRPTLFGFAFVIVSLFVFYTGVWFSKKHKLKKVKEYWVLGFLAVLSLYYSLIFSTFFRTHWIPALVICATTLGFLYPFLKKLAALKKIPLRFYKGLALTGLAFLTLSFFQIGGIPLLNSALRMNVDKSWAWSGAIFFLLFGYVGLLFRLEKRSHVYALIAGATIIMALTGFRVTILLFLLSGAIAAYKNKKLDNKTVLVPLACALLLLMFLGYFISGLANPVTLLFWRASTTHVVYEQVLDASIPFGVEQGNFMLGHARPRDYLGDFLGAKNSLTSTMLGPPLMEFGPICALLWMLFLGFVLGNAHYSLEKKEPLMKIFYPVLLALSLVWIEIGFDQYMLWFVWSYLIMRWLK